MMRKPRKKQSEPPPGIDFLRYVIAVVEAQRAGVQVPAFIDADRAATVDFVNWYIARIAANANLRPASAVHRRAAQGAQLGDHGSGGWYPIIREPWAGAWQRNVSINNDAAPIISCRLCVQNVDRARHRKAARQIGRER